LLLLGFVALGGSLLGACSSNAALVRVPHAPAVNVPPELERVVELGGLDLPSSGELSGEGSDGLITPGEWLVLLGSGLTEPSRVVRFGTVEAKVSGYTADGGLLVRVPRGLPRSLELSVTTSLGQSKLPIAVDSFVTVADVGASELRFFRTTEKVAQLGEELEGVPLPGLRSSVMSADGAMLYAISRKKEGGEGSDGGHRLVAVHLGAHGGPAVAGGFSAFLDDPPTVLALSPDGRRLFVLCEKSLALFDLEGRVTPRARGVLPLPPQGDQAPSARSLVVLAGGARVAILDSLGDRVLFVDTASTPKHMGSLDLKPADAAPDAPPTSFEIVGDANDLHAFWVLQGPNSRFAAQFLTEIGQGLRSFLPGTAPTVAATPPRSAWPTPFVRRFSFDGTAAQETTRIVLPENFLPLHLAHGPGGKLWVSGMTSDWSQVTLDAQSIMKALLSTKDVGRVLEVSPGGQVTTLLTGFLAVMQLTTVPGDDTPLYTAMRLGPSGFPPSIGVNWVAESYKTSSVKLRAMEWTSLLPPYLPPSVLAQ
jgi:hypothetical protein